MLFDHHTHYTGALPKEFIFRALTSRQGQLKSPDFVSLINLIAKEERIKDAGKLTLQDLLDNEVLLKELTTITRPSSFEHFQNVYRLIQKITKSPEQEENSNLLRNGSEAICNSYIQEEADGFSIRIGPVETVEGTIGRIQNTLEGFSEAKKMGNKKIISNITLTFIRDVHGNIHNIENPKKLRALLAAIKDEQEIQTNIDTFDFCGYEEGEIESLLEHIKVIQEIFPEKEITVHIGEQIKNRDQDKILKDFNLLIESGVKRFGHGILLWCPKEYLDNNELVRKREKILKRLSQQECTLEICPTSNILLGPIKKYSEIRTDYLDSFGVLYEVCTDNKSIFNTSLEKENKYIGVIN